MGNNIIKDKHLLIAVGAFSIQKNERIWMGILSGLFKSRETPSNRKKEVHTACQWVVYFLEE